MSAAKRERKKLFHYTSLEGAQAIVRSQNFRATFFEHLNDRSECRLFEEILRKEIGPPNLIDALNSLPRSQRRQLFNTENEKQALAKRQTEILVKSMYGAAHIEDLFIASFTEEPKNSYEKINGLLSLWRGYGKNGGCILVFDREQLEALLNKESEHYDVTSVLCPVIYENSDPSWQKDDVQAGLVHIGNYIKRLVADLARGAKQPTEVDKAFSEFFTFFSRYKHRAFHEEKEVRIAVLNHEKRIPIKVCRDREFIELFTDPKMRLPITEIIVGPHPDQDKRVQDLKSEFSKEGIIISASETPYVPS